MIDLRRRIAVVVALSPIALGAHVTQAAVGEAAGALEHVIAQYESISKRADPVSAGRDGDRDALRRLPEVARQAELARREELVALQRQLAAVARADLDADAAINHALLTRAVTQRIAQVDLDLGRIAFENDSGFHTLIDYLGRTTTIATREDAQAWLARVAAVAQYYDDNIDNLRRGIRTRFTQPRIVIDRVSAVARAHAQMAEDQHPALLPFQTATLDDAALREYRAGALKLVREQVLPAQRRFVEFLEREYLPAARPQLAWRTLPSGEESYRFLVRRETTTELSPEEIHRIGQQEVARIRQLMDAVLREVGFAGSFAEFLEHLRSDARFYARTPLELLEKASEIAKRADDRLPPLFATLPRLPYGVRPVPAEIAEGYTTGRYWPGSMPLGKAGGYMVNTARLDQRPLYELPALTLHEAVPGHHLQIALSQELAHLPYFRRTLHPTAFVEGWGLYAEFLGEEMGIYRDAYERFGRYSYEMWRACRLVADTGIHWLGWDIEEARVCFTENSALAPHNIQTELERYISWPGQALAYKLGELRLRELRQRAQRALGERFDVRKFHDAVLLGGALPLDVLELRIAEWVKAQGQALEAR